MKLTDKAYTILKYICQIAFPAVLTCTATILGLCGADAELTAIIVGIGTAVNTLLGTLLGISTHQYNKAHIADEIEEERWGEEDEDC